MFHLVLLAPPFFHAHTVPRRPRAHTLAQPQPESPMSPEMNVQPQTPARKTLASLNTPPPQASNISRLKAKGSASDPAYPRRRPTFGQVSSSRHHHKAIIDIEFRPRQDSSTSTRTTISHILWRFLLLILPHHPSHCTTHTRHPVFQVSQSLFNRLPGQSAPPDETIAHLDPSQRRVPFAACLPHPLLSWSHAPMSSVPAV